MAFTRDDFTQEFSKQLAEQHGGIRAAAQAVCKDAINHRGEVARAKTVEEWMTEALRGISIKRRASAAPFFTSSEVGIATKFLELWRKTGVDPKLVDEGTIELTMGDFKTWGVSAKIRDPRTHVERLVTKSLYSIGVKAKPAWEDGPKWPVITPAAPTQIVFAEPRTRTDGIKTYVALSDPHNGFLRPIGDESNLQPIHDPRAIDVAEQIVAFLQPHGILHVGDDIDLPEHSKFTQHPEFARTTQAGINETHLYYARMEAAAGPRFIRKGGHNIERREKTRAHGGNHGNRLQRLLLNNAVAAYGLRRADRPKGWPAMSFPEMVALDVLDIEYVGEKLGTEYYLTDTLRVVHEPTVGKVQDPVNEVHGHLHRWTLNPRTVWTRGGAQVFTSYGIACLASLDRYPDEASLLATKLPANVQRNRCQQGIGVISIASGGAIFVEQVPINNGVALFRGHVFESRV